MNQNVAENFADILQMPLVMSGHRLRGKIKVPVTVGDCTIQFKMKVVHNWECNGDASVLLTGPGSLLMFVGYRNSDSSRVFLVLDGRALATPEKVAQWQKGAKSLSALVKGLESATRAKFVFTSKEEGWRHVS